MRLPMRGSCATLGPMTKRRAAVALAALSAFLLAFVLSAAPALHEHLHSDAAHSQHECAISIVESGVQTANAPLTVAAPQLIALLSSASPLRAVWVPAVFLTARVFEHAPPAFS